MDANTIVAISTASGSGLKGIIRISGSDSFSIVNRFWDKPLQPVIYRCVEGYIRIDCWHTQVPAMLYLMKAPYSYTCEDCIEIHTFSSPVLLEIIMRQLLDSGASPAAPGEFTRRAFLAGRIDLAQAESIMALISASSEAERRMAIMGVSGVLSKEISELQNSLTFQIALMEAHIDFLEEEIPPLATDHVIEQLTKIIQRLRNLGESGHEIASRAIVVCLCGLPNSGKSTLFNKLLQREVALTSEISGTTLDWLEEEICIDEIMFKFLDTPGVEESPVGIQEKAQQRVPELLSGADIALFLVDGSQEFSKENRKLLQYLPEIPTLLVITKNDLKHGTSTEDLVKETRINDFSVISTISGEGLESLQQWLLNAAYKIQQTKQPSLFNARQYSSAKQACELIENSIEALETGISYEFVAVDLRCALDFLGEIAGKVTTEHILDHVFSQFCIGK